MAYSWVSIQSLPLVKVLHTRLYSFPWGNLHPITDQCGDTEPDPSVLLGQESNLSS